MMKLLTKALEWAGGFTTTFWLALVAVLIACLPLSYCKGRSDGRAIESAKWERAAAKAQEQARKADAMAGEQRAADTIRNTDMERARTDAIDKNPDDPRLGLNCARLRAAGVDTPAACAGR